MELKMPSVAATVAFVGLVAGLLPGVASASTVTLGPEPFPPSKVAG
jgi:hypothetical protein